MSAFLLDQALRLQNQGQFAEAEKLYSQALRTVRNNPALWFNHGLVLRDLGEPKKALASFEQAARLSPPMAEIENERGNALLELGRHNDAMTALSKALALRPLHPGTLTNRGLVQVALGRLDAALADFDAALRLEPRLPVALINRGAVLEKLGRAPEALSAYRQALAFAPGDATALYHCGVLLARMDRHAEALAHYDRALAGSADEPAIRFNRARTLLALKRIAEAHAEMKRLFAEHPDDPFVFTGLLDTSLMAADFDVRATLEAGVENHVRAGRPLSPLRLLQCSDDPALQRLCATAHVQSQTAHIAALPPRRVADARRLKVAYLSQDFRDHPVAVHGSALWERHDRGAFELFAVSTGHDDASPQRRRVLAAFEHVLDVREQSDDAVAALLAQAEIDILVDLGGHTSGARLGIPARRPAPIQVNFLGWPGTSGSSFIDYMIADAVVAPPGSDAGFTEKLVRLPHCYHPTDPGRDPFAATATRAEAGLPPDAFVFCAFNSVWKIAPAVFQAWMGLLRDIPGSVLWLRHDNDEASRNLLQAAAAQGVAPERLVFAGPAPGPEHIARFRLADLFLDTLPFAGHSTAIESLWAGLPLVSCAGTGFAARVSASALHAVGMPELATTSLADYQALALALARDPARLGSYRQRLDAGRGSLPLFDATAHARALEDAYQRMADIARAGRPPEAFTVPG